MSPTDLATWWLKPTIVAPCVTAVVARTGEVSKDAFTVLPAPASLVFEGLVVVVALTSGVADEKLIGISVKKELTKAVLIPMLTFLNNVFDILNHLNLRV